MKCRYCGLEIELEEGTTVWALTHKAHQLANQPKRGTFLFFRCSKNPTHQPIPESQRVLDILERYEH